MLQQYLPFTVLKPSLLRNPIHEAHKVATVLTTNVYDKKLNNLIGIPYKQKNSTLDLLR